MIDLIVSRCSTHGLLLCFRLLHISNGSVSTLLVGHVLYSADLMFAICSSHYYLIVYGYIYSRYSSVFLMLYQLYHSLSSSTLISSSSFYLKLQPELFLKVVTGVLAQLSFLCSQFAHASTTNCWNVKDRWTEYGGTE